jgi:hypothetical protein
MTMRLWGYKVGFVFLRTAKVSKFIERRGIFCFFSVKRSDDNVKIRIFAD